MSTKTIKITENHSVTLGEVTRVHLLKAMQDDLSGRYESMKPPPVEGYSHELAYQNIEEYRQKWDAYATKVYNSWVYLMFGLAWQIGGLDMEEEEYQAERKAAVSIGRRLGLHAPNGDDAVEMGALVYALIELRAGHQVRDEVTAWLNKEAGLLDTASVAEERKSPEGDGEQPAPGGSERGNKKPRKGRG